MASMPLINICNVSNGRNIAVVPHKGYESEVVSALKNDSFSSDSYYVWSYPTDENLFALSLTANMETGEMSEELKVINWDGSVFKSYKINDFLTSFYVNGKQVVGITMNGELLSYTID